MIGMSALIALSATAQTSPTIINQSTALGGYSSSSLVDTNSTSNSVSTINSNTVNSGTVTNNNNTALSGGTTNVNTNNNVQSGTVTNNNVLSGSVTYTNNNVQSGTLTNNNNNVNTSTSTNTNYQYGTMTNNNNNVNTSTSTSTSTNTNNNNNVNTGTMTYNNNNVNTGTMTNNNNNVNASTSTATNNNVNQNIQSGTLNNNNNNVSDITQRVIQPPPTAIAPAMMSGGNADLCTTGTSGSVQTQIFGVSTGGTVRDLNCERLKLSKTLYDMGMKVAAVATMCQDRRVFDAMAQAGTPCPYEGKIGEQAKAAWADNPEKMPKDDEKDKVDDTKKNIGLGALLGILAFKLF